MAKMKFSEIDAWQTRNGLTRSDVARLLGVSTQRLNGWRARGNVSADESDRVRAIVTGNNARQPLDDEYLTEAGQYDGLLTTQERRDLSAHKGRHDTNILIIQQLDVRASMGLGMDLQEHVDVVRTVRVSLPELRRQVPHFSAPENLRILTGLGDSMKPTFQDGDPLLIDIGVSEITVDGVYVLEKDDQLYVKRMQRRLIDGSLMMISDNKDYGSELITNGDRQKFAVRGRVLLAWNARRM